MTPRRLLPIALVLAAGCSDEPDLTGCENCVEGCGGSACTLDCKSASCNDRVIRCPPDRPCHLQCNGLDACDTTTVECPDGFACTVQCEDKDACGDMILHCGTSDCSIQCGTHSAACEGAVVNCGSGACAATCAGTSKPEMKGCSSAASCTQC